MPPSGKSEGPDPAERAVRALERGATTLGVGVARSLYSRWRRMPAGRRAQLERLADNVKERALDARGDTDAEAAGRELRDANERLADAMVESAQADPELSEVEVTDLRADLARELDRLADADIKASRGPGRIAS
ncbi:MAG: hypothetical protein WD993_09630 [Thermoleophilaceae bacterium]